MSLFTRSSGDELSSAASPTISRDGSDLFTLLEHLETRGAEHLTSRLKPLTLLWAMGRIAEGKPRMIEWQEFRDTTSELFEQYGRPLDTPDPQYPFWDLRTSDIWDFPLECENPRFPYAPRLEWLESRNPSAGFTDEVARTLRNPNVRLRAANTIAKRFFSEVDRSSLLADAKVLKKEDMHVPAAPTQVSQRTAIGGGATPTQSPTVREDSSTITATAPVHPDKGLDSHSRAPAISVDYNPQSTATTTSTEAPTDEHRIEDSSAISEREYLRLPNAQGRTSDPRVNRALEIYAEDAAITYFMGHDWTARRVGHLKLGYDLLCTDTAGGILHVEVKGTQNLGKDVFLTPNEVLHVESNCNAQHALFVLSEIKLIGDDHLSCSGGSPRVVWPWTIDRDLLAPTQFSYRVPEPSETLDQPKANVSELLPTIPRTRSPASPVPLDEICPSCNVRISVLGRCRCSS